MTPFAGGIPIRPHNNVFQQEIWMLPLEKELSKLKFNELGIDILKCHTKNPKRSKS